MCHIKINKKLHTEFKNETIFNSKSKQGTFQRRQYPRMVRFARQCLATKLELGKDLRYSVVPSTYVGEKQLPPTDKTYKSFSQCGP